MQIVLMPRGPPGRCLSLGGRQAGLEIALKSPIVATHITLEHVPWNISRSPGSAPKTFFVFGHLSYERWAFTHERQEEKCAAHEKVHTNQCCLQMKVNPCTKCRL